MLVPYHDVAGVETSSQQPFDDRCDQRRTRAAMAAHSAIDFEAEDILRLGQLTPGSRRISRQEQLRDSLVRHLPNGFGPRLKGIGSVFVFDDHDSVAGP